MWADGHPITNGDPILPAVAKVELLRQPDNQTLNHTPSPMINFEHKPKRGEQQTTVNKG